MVSGRREYQKAPFVEMVQELQTLSTKPWPYFTADGNCPPTRARSAVWDAPVAFKAAAEAVGNRCKACHQQFRYE